MKKWILRAGLALFAMSGFLFVTGFLNRKTDLYKNMVNASVYIDGRGSGVFIDDDVILTAAHCVKGEKSFSIQFSNGIKLKSKNFWVDKKEDIAFIFVTVKELHIAKITSVTVNIGDPVYLVGRPQGKAFMFSLTKGIISHLGRDFSDMNWKNLIQTDAEGGPGSSGGPLYNSNGQLIGMYVGHAGDGGRGISLCESAKSILEAYERCMESRDAPN